MHSSDEIKSNAKTFPDILAIHIALVLISLEGTLVFLASLVKPSAEQSAIFLGFSLQRLAIEATLLLLVLSALGALFKFTFDIRAAQNIITSLQAFFQPEPVRLWNIVSFTISVSIAGFYFFVLQRFFPSAKVPNFINILFLHFSSTLLWLTAVPFQLVLSTLFICRASIRPMLRLIWADITPHLFPLVILTGAFHCITLFLRSNLLFGIPEWFWRITPKSYNPALLLFSPFAVFALIVARYIIHKSRASSGYFVFSVALILMLQIAFGAASGHGLESLRLKYIKAPISHEAHVACEYPDGTLSAIKNYESNFADDFWLGTKPPGLLAIFIIIRDATRALSGQNFSGADICFDMITKVMEFLFPFLASLVLVPIYYLSQILIPGDRPHDPSILYMSAPAILLMTLIRDQAIYPFLAAITLVIAVKSALSKSIPLAIATGFLLFVLVFFSFSLLPIVGLVFVFHAIIGLRDRGHFHLSRTFTIIGAMIIGIALAWIIGNTLLSYDPIERYRAAIHLHRTIKNFLPDPLSLLRNAFINSLEFIMAAGAPIIMLFLISVGQSIISIFRRAISNSDAFALATLCTFMILHIIGQTRGETARLWLFMMVPVTVIAARPARRMQTKFDSAFLSIFAIQILVSFLTFTNMDFR